MYERHYIFYAEKEKNKFIDNQQLVHLFISLLTNFLTLSHTVDRYIIDPTIHTAERTMLLDQYIRSSKTTFAVIWIYALPSGILSMNIYISQEKYALDSSLDFPQ